MARSAGAHAPKSKVLNDKYLLGDEIGKGAYGRVYKGVDLQNGDFVAIKQVSLENIPSEDLASIMQEIDLLKNLNHRNIVKYLGSFKTKSHLYIILEYVENGSLASIIKPSKFGAFPESLVAIYIAQVLEGLVYLHEQGVIHRDIKGANILTTKEGLVKLADFGVATKLNEVDHNAQSSHPVGTPYWMAPEVIEMSGVSAASDIWSVGCTVIELLTCAPPYYDLHHMPALFRIVQDDKPPLPDHLSASLREFLELCFQKDASLRPDAKELLKHQWFTSSRKALQRSLKKTGGRISNIPEDVSLVLERTIEGGEFMDILLSQEPSVGGAVSVHDPFDTDSPHKLTDFMDSVLVEPLLEPDWIMLKEDEYTADGKPGSRSNSLRLPRQQNHLSTQQVLVKDPKDASTSKTQPALASIEGPVRKSRSLNGVGTLEGETVLLLSSFDTAGDVEDPDSLPPIPPLTPPKLPPRHAPRPSAKVKDITVTVLRTPPPRKREVSSRTSFGLESLEREDPVENLESPAWGGRDPWEDVGMVSRAPSDDYGALTTNGPRALDGAAVEAAQAADKSHVRRQLAEQLQTAVVDGESSKPAATDDEFDELEQQALDGHKFAKQAMEMTRLLALLKPEASEETVVSAGHRLAALLDECPALEQELVQRYTISPIVDLLYSRNPWVLVASLKVVNRLSKNSSDLQEMLCLMGLVPTVMQLSGPAQPKDVRLQAAKFIDQMCHRSNKSLQMLMACKGCAVLVSLLEPEYNIYWELVHTGLDGICTVFGYLQTKGEKAKSSFRRLFAKCGALEHLVKSLHSLQAAGRYESTDGVAAGPPSAVPAAKSTPIRRYWPARRASTGELHPASLSQEGEREVHIVPPSRAGWGQSWAAPTSGQQSSQPLHQPFGPAQVTQGPSALTSGAMDFATPTSNVNGSAHMDAALTRLKPGGAVENANAAVSADIARRYEGKAADLLLEFAQGDELVKGHICEPDLLLRLFQLIPRLQSYVLLKVLTTIQLLTMDPNTLEPLQRADAIRHLVPVLQYRTGDLVSDIHSQVLGALYNLCKINKRRQEQAAEAGIIPQLLHSPLQGLALPLLCDMAHASTLTREQLRVHGALELYVKLLQDDYWAVTALDSLVACLANDNEQRRVETALLKREALLALVAFFHHCNPAHPSYPHILEPYLKLITKSVRLNTALALAGLTPLLVQRLDHRDAIARLTILKMIKAIYEHHRRPKQLIVEHDLPSKLQRLMEERRDGERSGGQVLVKQMASSLLKGLHINTVL
eukprot:SM000055S18281  [mRNA]  locus=s55:503995:513174:+ [translate_table: standard]